MTKIFISAGETSGEKYGAALIREFKRLNPQAKFFGLGGEKMLAAGLEPLASLRELNLIGVFEIISHFPRILKLYSWLKKEITRRQPQAAVLIDSPDFHLRLGRFLRRKGVPVLYYVSPTVWAWRKNRLKTIKKSVTKMLLIFPFEQKIYEEAKIPAAYIGHPLQEEIKLSLSREEFLRKYNLDHRKKIIALLPGSRPSELKNHLPQLTETLHLLRSSLPVEFLLCQSENLTSSEIDRYLPYPFPELKILKEDKYEAMAYSDLILASCGISNLEAALLEKPLIAFYRISPFTYYLGKKFVYVKNYSIVNILLEQRVIPELIQHNFTAENLFLLSQEILENQERREQMIRSFQKMKEILGNYPTSSLAAQELINLLKNSS